MNGLAAFASFFGLLFLLIPIFLFFLVLYVVIVKAVKRGVLQAWDQIEYERAQELPPPPEDHSPAPGQAPPQE